MPIIFYLQRGSQLQEDKIDKAMKVKAVGGEKTAAFKIGFLKTYVPPNSNNIIYIYIYILLRESNLYIYSFQKWEHT